MVRKLGRRRPSARMCVVVFGASLVAGCGTGHARNANRTEVEAWPQADALFHRDPRWRGGDGAFSVDLGRGRVLWLFGDSFVATTPAHTREQSWMVRNSVGLMTGVDPTTAKMRFYWRTGSDGKPASYFPEEGKSWFWPADGVRLGSKGPLLLFLSRERRDPTGPPGFDFTGAGWKAVLVPNPGRTPNEWTPESVRQPRNPWGIQIGDPGLYGSRGWLYAFGTPNAGTHDAFLLRWPLVAAVDGDLSSPEWWAGEARGFVPQAALDVPTPLFYDSDLPETVQRITGGRFVMTETVGFGATAALGVRNSPALTGPWSKVTEIWRPEESHRTDVNLYGFKGHPELAAGGTLAVTYVANGNASKSFAALLADESIYYPRFARVRLAPALGGRAIHH